MQLNQILASEPLYLTTKFCLQWPASQCRIWIQKSTKNEPVHALRSNGSAIVTSRNYTRCAVDRRNTLWHRIVLPWGLKLLNDCYPKFESRSRRGYLSEFFCVVLCVTMEWFPI